MNKGSRAKASSVDIMKLTQTTPGYHWQRCQVTVSDGIGDGGKKSSSGREENLLVLRKSVRQQVFILVCQHKDH